MTRWDIDPTGVQTVLRSTEAVATEFDGQMTTLNAGMEGAMAQSSSDLVNSALAGFAQSAADSISFVFTRTGACLGGAAQATNSSPGGPRVRAATAPAGGPAPPAPGPTRRGGGARQ